MSVDNKFRVDLDLVIFRSWVYESPDGYGWKLKYPGVWLHAQFSWEGLM